MIILDFKLLFVSHAFHFQMEDTKLCGEYELIDCAQNENVLDLKVICGHRSGFKAALAYKQEGTISQMSWVQQLLIKWDIFLFDIQSLLWNYMIMVHSTMLKPKDLALLSHRSLLTISKYTPQLGFVCLKWERMQRTVIFAFKACIFCANSLFSSLNADMACSENIGRRGMHTLTAFHRSVPCKHGICSYAFSEPTSELTFWQTLSTGQMLMDSIIDMTRYWCSS